MDDETRVRLSEVWDSMDNAAQRVLTAQPFQMTEAATSLDAARLAMRAAIIAVLMGEPLPAQEPPHA